MNGIPMTCRDCGWRGVFSEAVNHHRASRHQLLHKGHAQDLSGFIGTCKQCQCDLAISPSMIDGLLPNRQVCDRCIFDTQRREWQKSA